MKNLISNYRQTILTQKRSINISLDSGSKQSFDDYIVSTDTVKTLQSITNSLQNQKAQPSQDRAFSITGPYGSGKSAFTLFLSHLLGNPGSHTTQNALQKLSENNADIIANKIADITKNTKGFLVIPVVASKNPATQILTDAITSTINTLSDNTSVQKQAQKFLGTQKQVDGNTVIQLLELLSYHTKKHGYAGVLIAVDEAGKTLEYYADNKQFGDIYIFQQIAEYVNRETQTPILFIITLHQALDDYISINNTTIKNEWGKIRGRFFNIEFQQNPAGIINILSKVIQPVQQLPDHVKRSIKQDVKSAIKDSLYLPDGIASNRLLEIAEKCYPLHVSTIIALPYLFYRLAQNERTVFQYLNSQEPYGFQETINTTIIDGDNNIILLHNIYDYILENFKSSLPKLSFTKTLFETENILNRATTKIDTKQQKVLKTISMLNVLGEICPIKATAQTIKNFTRDATQENKRTLEQLERQSKITYRKLDETYHIWKGSDLNITELVLQARPKTRETTVETISKYLPQKKFIAKKHGIETGVTRVFPTIYTDKISEKYLSRLLQKYGTKDGYGGVIVTLITEENRDNITKHVQKVLSNRNFERVVVAIPDHIDPIINTAKDLSCLKYVEHNTPQLQYDKTAKQEILIQTSQAEQHLHKNLKNILDPRKHPLGHECKYYHLGKPQTQIQRPSDVTRLISNICDQTYSQCPTIKNEMIAKNSISGSITSARRLLSEHMVEHSHQENLDIKGYPAQRSLYEALLKTSNIHFYDTKTKTYRLQIPPENHDPLNFRRALKHFETKIFSNNSKPVNLTNIYKELQEPPFGIPDGTHPILFTIFYLIHKDELFLYRDGSYLPEASLAIIELLQRRPELFSISGTRVTGDRKKVVERLSNSLKTEAKVGSVVRSLIQMIATLPKVTLNTTLIDDKQTQKVRNVLLEAREPEKLLFNDLPEALQLPSFTDKTSSDRQIETFFDNLNATISKLASFATELEKQKRNTILKSCELPQIQQGWLLLEQKAQELSHKTNNKTLIPFLNSAIKSASNNHSPRPVISYIAGKSFNDWTDVDIKKFDGIAKSLGEIFSETYQNHTTTLNPTTSKHLTKPENLTAEEQKQAKTLLQQLKKQDIPPKIIKTLLWELYDKN